jgi:hexosaminidase
MVRRISRFTSAALVLVLLGSGQAAAEPARAWNIVPAPAHIQPHAGLFSTESEIAIVLANPANADLQSIGELAVQIVREAWQVPASVQVHNSTKREIVLTLVPSPSANPESYTLDVETQHIALTAPTPAGLFYAAQTLRQLLTPATAKSGIAAVHIEDAPRFAYRGMHLDVGRHLYAVEFIKRYIDLMARYKFNTFHWHLTEDQGWRLEIKRYPKLTEVGAWRKETIWGRNFDPYFGDGVRYGGFYTQEQVRDVVAYAQARHVAILPEIDLPGHMKAALAAYPELACTPGPFEVSTIWGVEDDVLCPSETTFQFLEGVLTEVMELFPSRYIHLGGDEAPTKRWKESKLAQDIMRREHYSREVELQGYFLRRLEKFLGQHGRRLIGWDEILAGGLSPDATVMSWRGMDGGTAAAQQNHDVIMTPGEFAYFDHCEGDPERDPICLAGDHLPLAQVYRFEPVPPQLSASQAKHILGGQANVWTEYLPTAQTVEYMAFPRELAMAEVLWSPRDRRDWQNFESRLGPQLAELDRLGVRYRIPDVDGLDENMATLDANTQVSLHSPLACATIRYTLDGSIPDAESPRYEHPLDLTLDAEGIAVAARVILADGRKGPVRRATFRRTSLHAALRIDTWTLKPGLARNYYEHELANTRGFARLQPAKRDIATQIAIPDYARPESFALTFDGYLRVPADGLYDFRLESDDGAVLRIDGDLVVDRDGPQSLAESAGQIGLAAGLHAISLKYFQDDGGKGLNLRMRAGTGSAQPLPEKALFHHVESPTK